MTCGIPPHWLLVRRTVRPSVVALADDPDHLEVDHGEAEQLPEDARPQALGEVRGLGLRLFGADQLQVGGQRPVLGIDMSAKPHRHEG